MDLLEKFQLHMDTQKKFGYISNQQAVKLLQAFGTFQKDGNYDRCPESIIDFLNLTACQALSAELFALDVVKDLPPTKAKTILDAASGMGCASAHVLSQFNYKQVYAIDEELKQAAQGHYDKIYRMGNSITCDELAGRGKGTDFSMYDYVVSCKPCAATERIARQCLRQDKGFIALLCICNNKTIYDHSFSSVEQWYDYLDKISTEARIVEVNKIHYFTNLPSINPTLVPYRSVYR